MQPAASGNDVDARLRTVIRKTLEADDSGAATALSWLRAGIIVAAMIYVGIQVFATQGTPVTADDLFTMFSPD